MSTPQLAPDMALPALTLDELQQPSTQQSERLLELASRVYKNKPWKKLEEDEIFIVKNPDDGELLFVGAIGGAGEQSGVIVYRGVEAYFGLLDFIERASELPALPQIPENAPGAEEMMALLTEALSQANFNPMELMQLPQLQLMFEPKAQLEEMDEKWLKRHSYKASGTAFPTFRSVASGFLPWWMSAREADLLIVALEQLLEVIERKDFSPDLLEILEAGDEESEEDEGLDLFARVPTKEQDGAVAWSDERLVVKPFSGEPVQLQFSPDMERVERVLRLPASREVVEVAMVSLPTPLGDANTRPCFPTMLLLGHKGQVVAMETMHCGIGYALTPQIIEATIKLLSERDKRPKTLQFSSPDLDILNALGQKLGIAIEEVDELETLDPAIESLMEQMANVDLDDLDAEDFDPKELPKFLH